MGRKDASTSRTPVDQYRKQIGKQDYKKTRPMLRATRLKAEAKKTALGVKEVALVLAAILGYDTLPANSRRQLQVSEDLMGSGGELLAVPGTKKQGGSVVLASPRKEQA
uniref:Triple QxxK/R motif-containing protein n=1 Tax=Ficedula albicollis TaxID=59894 RepID=U3JS46_FICAL